MLNLYNTIVRSNVEYRTSVWSPHYEKDKYLIKKVQPRFTKIVQGLVRYPYPERLQQLGLWS